MSPIIIVSPVRGTGNMKVKRIQASYTVVQQRREWAEKECGWTTESDEGYEPIYPSQVQSLHKLCKFYLPINFAELTAIPR